MHIALVQPRGSNWLPELEDVIQAANLMPPIGLCCLAAYLEREGISSELIDCYVRKSEKETWAQYITRQQPGWVGFSTTTSSFMDAYSIAQEIKQINSSISVVFGGVHVSALRESILHRFPAIDYVVVGEGEKTIVELIRGTAPASIAGLVYRNADGVQFTSYRDDLLDLDSLPFPAYHRLADFPKRYYLPLFNYPRVPNCTMISSRGCPYQCSYCDRSVFRKGFRYNSAEYIYEHLSYLCKHYKIRHVTFYDDLFTFDRERIAKLCAMLVQKPLGVGFNCIVQLAHVDQDLLRMLKQAGCWMVNVGIESGDPELLRMHKAELTIEEIAKKVLFIKKSGLRVKGLFIMGLPGETEASIARTTEFIKTLQVDDLNMAKFAPYPGAPLFPKLPELGTLIEDWNRMNGMNFLFLPKGIASFEELERLYNKFIKTYYQSPRTARNFIKMFWQSPHSWYMVFRQLPTFLRARKAFDM